MTSTTNADRLQMHWHPVTDSAGITRMEATWTTVSAVAAAPVVHAA